MMRILICITLLSVILSLSVVQCTMAETDIPDWLNGKLFITSLGFDKLDWDNPFEWKKYVRIYDFENETHSALEVPRDAHLTHDLGEEKKPIIISHAALGYSEDFGWESDGRWKGFSVASYNDVSGFSYGVSENVTYFHDGFYYFTPYGNGMTFDAPVQVLEIKSPAYCVYLLEYCVSDESELKIQFVCETSEGKVVYDRYPLDYQWGKWVYAISPNGCVAYKDAGSNQIVVNTENKLVYIPDTENTLFIEWRNEQELLLFTCNDTTEAKYCLVVYNVDDATLETVLSSSGEPICVENAYFYDMDINQKLDCLAFCYVTNPNGKKETKLEVVSLWNGMRYSLDLYPMEKLCSEEGRTIITNEIYRVNKKHAYSASDNGIYFFEPSDDIHLELVWY